MSDVGKEIVTGLEGFLADLKADKEFDIVEVTRTETENGPVYTRTKKKVRLSDVPPRSEDERS